MHSHGSRVRKAARAQRRAVGAAAAGLVLAVAALLGTARATPLASVAGVGSVAGASAPRLVRAAADDGGLHVAVTATGSPRRGAVRYTIRATDARAPGALGYEITFGDGASARSALPQFCVSGRGRPTRARWRVTHRYTSGTYHVTVTVRANCTQVAATARLTVKPG